LNEDYANPLQWTARANPTRSAAADGMAAQAYVALWKRQYVRTLEGFERA